MTCVDVNARVSPIVVAVIFLLSKDDKVLKFLVMILDCAYPGTRIGWREIRAIASQRDIP